MHFTFKTQKIAVKRLKEINIKWQRAWFSNLDSDKKKINLCIKYLPWYFWC